MGWIIYAIAGYLWGSFSFTMQSQRTNTTSFKNKITFVLNFVGWPIGMIIAIYKLKQNKSPDVPTPAGPLS
jgi:uncharacterized protein with PQ loop repeat